MAELTHPRARAQLAAIARLRGREFWNGLRKRGGDWELIARLLMGLFLVTIALGGAAGFAAGVFELLTHGLVDVFVPGLFWVIFGFWQVMPIMTSAFAQAPDSSLLPRFPLRYRTYALVRLLYGGCDAYTAVGAAWVGGVALGAVLARPEDAAVVLGAALLFFTFNFLLAQAVFAWLERWLARRRSRELMAGLFMLLMLALQVVPRVLARHIGHGGPHAARAWLLQMAPWERLTPMGLAGTALRAPALAGLGALGLLGLWTLAIAAALHLRYRAQFRGEEFGGAAAPGRRRALPARRAAGTRGAGLGLPGVAGAMAAKELLYLKRSPPLLLQSLSPAVAMVALAATVTNPILRHGFRNYSPLMAAGFGLLGSLVLTFNCFATDGAAVMNYFSAPVELGEVLLGKNLAAAALIAVQTLVAGGAAALVFGAPRAGIAVATLAALGFAALVNFCVGNLFSVHHPRPMQLGRWGRQGGSNLANLGSSLLLMAILGVCALGFAAGRLAGSDWWTALGFVLLDGVAVTAYRGLLPRAARRAVAEREHIMAELARAPG